MSNMNVITEIDSPKFDSKNIIFCYSPIRNGLRDLLLWNKIKRIYKHFFLDTEANAVLTWSAHQYQMEAGLWPNKKPGHGISGSDGCLKRTSQFGLISWHVVFSTVALTIASGYRLHNSAIPPISRKPWPIGVK